MRYFSGNEKITLNGKELRYSMLDYWRSYLSDILFNMTRGSFAEFLVRCAMAECGYNALSQEKTGVEAWDIDGPSIKIKGVFRKSRIEVKSTASVQHNTPDSAEPITLPDTALKFSIKKAIDWTDIEAGPNHNNDLYVFAHYKAKYKDNDMLDMSFWDFYVYPTFKIDENPQLEKQKTISVYRLKKLGVQPQSFDTLYQEILRVLDEISEHFSKEEMPGKTPDIFA